MISCYAKGYHEFNPHKDTITRATFFQCVDFTYWHWTLRPDVAQVCFPAHSGPKSSAVIAYSGHHHDRRRMTGRSLPVLRLRAAAPRRTRCKPRPQLQSRTGEQTTADPSRIDSLSAKTSNNDGAARHVSASEQQKFSAEPGSAGNSFRASSPAHAAIVDLQWRCAACSYTSNGYERTRHLTWPTSFNADQSWSRAPALGDEPWSLSRLSGGFWFAPAGAVLTWCWHNYLHQAPKISKLEE